MLFQRSSQALLLLTFKVNICAWMPALIRTLQEAPVADRRDVDEHVAFLRALATAGIDDLLVLRSETAASVLTEKRMKLVEEVSSGQVKSVRDLARRLDRDVSIVSRDLDVLFEAGVIAFEDDGRAKRPVLAHENVLVRPIVFDGEVVRDDRARTEA